MSSMKMTCGLSSRGIQALIVGPAGTATSSWWRVDDGSAEQEASELYRRLTERSPLPKGPTMTPMKRLDHRRSQTTSHCEECGWDLALDLVGRECPVRLRTALDERTRERDDLASTSAAAAAWERHVRAEALREAADAIAAVAPGERVLLGSDVASLLRARADAIEKGATP